MHYVARQMHLRFMCFHLLIFMLFNLCVVRRINAGCKYLDRAIALKMLVVVQWFVLGKFRDVFVESTLVFFVKSLQFSFN